MRYMLASFFEPKSKGEIMFENFVQTLGIILIIGVIVGMFLHYYPPQPADWTRYTSIGIYHIQIPHYSFPKRP